MVEVNHSVIIFKSASDKAYYSTTTVCVMMLSFAYFLCVFYILLYFIIHVAVLMC
jgi:hypothetical protein